VRARNVKPGLFKNDVLAELPILTRYVFIGLWCMADREGRLQDRPARIKAEILPYDDADMDACLGELEAHGFIIRYVIDGQRLIWIVKFSCHQKPHQNETPSKLPAYDDIAKRDQVLATKAPSTRADSLIPDSLIPDSLIPYKTLGQSGAKTGAAPTGFDEFWIMYPNKKGKGAAVKAYRAALKKATVETIRNGLEAQLPEFRARDPQYVPRPSTWLNGESWGDVLDVPIDLDLLRKQRLRELRTSVGDEAVHAMCETEELWQEVCGA
jgi:hypothetical protein